MRGLIYQNPWVYNIAMRLIYNRDFKRRYELVAAYIEKDWSVLDLCCGDCYIKNFLDKSIKYEGRDFNELFLEKAKKKGLCVSFCDLKKKFEEKKKFDCVIMMGSLHQFIPNEDTILNNMKKAASKRIIVSEPCRNIVSFKNRYISFLAKLLSNPGDEGIYAVKRFTRDEIITIFEQHGTKNIVDAGKDLIGIFDL